uniref:Uncharacterized protein n=2 Tax=Nothobranchius pienaari TaxID=704102 RepID=A0A1A8L6Z7_9TELE
MVSVILGNWRRIISSQMLLLVTLFYLFYPTGAAPSVTTEQLDMGVWDLIENTTLPLEPFEELTKEICSSTASAADVIPSVLVLKRLLAKDAAADHGVKTTKARLLEAVSKRFADIKKDPLQFGNHHRPKASQRDPNQEAEASNTTTSRESATTRILFFQVW